MKVSDFRKHDRIRFKYGSSVYTGTVTDVAPEHNMIRVRFGPWLIFGEWVEIQTWTKPTVIGRSRVGRFIDWYMDGEE